MNETARAGTLRLDPTGENLSTRKIVHRWHDETHAFAFQLCQEQPCRAINDEWFQGRA